MNIHAVSRWEGSSDSTEGTAIFSYMDSSGFTKEIRIPMANFSVYSLLLNWSKAESNDKLRSFKAGLTNLLNEIS